MTRLVFYWYWPKSDTYCRAATPFSVLLEVDDFYRSRNLPNVSFLATVVW